MVSTAESSGISICGATPIALSRSALRYSRIKEAHVQAGTGIVLESVGSRKNAECEDKAAAVIQAVQDAGSLSALREDEQ